MDRTINGLTDELNLVTDENLLVVWASGKTQKVKASTLTDYAKEKIAKFQPGETLGGATSGYSFQIPGQTFNSTAQFTLILPKNASGRNVEYVAGNIVNIIYNGRTVDVSNQTPTMILTNYGYAIRFQFTGSFTSGHSAILQMNSDVIFN